MTDQELKNKYQPVADFMSHNGFQIQHFHAENGKAVLTATAKISSFVSKNKRHLKGAKTQALPSLVSRRFLGN